LTRVLETIEWFDPREQLPDADAVVLVRAPAKDEPVWLGWYDGVYWFCVDGSEYEEGTVTGWAAIPSGEPDSDSAPARRAP